MQRGRRLEARNGDRFESETPSFRGGNIYGLSLIFILLTVTTWLATVLVGACKFVCSGVWHGSAAMVVVIVLVTLATMDLAHIRLSARFEWLLTLVLIAAMTIWSMSIINNTPPADFSIILGCVIVSMVVLSAIGAKISLDSIAVYATVIVIWFFVSLVLIVVIMFLMIVLENGLTALYLLAVMIYPLFISLVIYDGMLIRSGHVCSHLLSGE